MGVEDHRGEDDREGTELGELGVWRRGCLLRSDRSERKKQRKEFLIVWKPHEERLPQGGMVSGMKCGRRGSLGPVLRSVLWL